MIVIGKNQSMVEVARRTLALLPRGKLRQVHALPRGHRLAGEDPGARRGGEGRTDDIALMLYIADMIAGKSFCPFSYAAVWGLQSNLAKFRPEFEAAIAGGHGQAGAAGPADLPARYRHADPA